MRSLISGSTEHRFREYRFRGDACGGVIRLLLIHLLYLWAGGHYATYLTLLMGRNYMTKTVRANKSAGTLGLTHKL